MVVFGREVKFRKSIYAVQKLAKLAPGGDINRLGELFAGDYASNIDAAAAFVVALNEAYELAERFNRPGYEPDPITKEMVLLLDEQQFGELVAEAMQVYKSQPEIRTTPKKKGAGRA